jgi:trk system potassium uptake protein TrkA
MYLLIVGAGKIGEKLIELALQNKDDVVVIEKEKEKCEEISKKYDVIVINADATLKETLIEAGADSANAILTTADDATNLLVISLAKSLGIPLLVSVVNEEENRAMFIEKGVNIVENPSLITAEHLYRAIRHPLVKEYINLGDKMEIFKIGIQENSKMVGRKVEDARLPKMVTLIAIERGEQVIIPLPDTSFEAGDLITFLARKDKIDDVMKIFLKE